ncbi:hypothetical protein N0824_02788 [Microcystis sp. 0824]|nr:hypothetical protein N0824_02788 [Microcystis sp. 0824]
MQDYLSVAALLKNGFGTLLAKQQTFCRKPHIQYNYYS